MVILKKLCQFLCQYWFAYIVNIDGGQASRPMYTIDLNNDATTLALLDLIMDAGGVFFDQYFEVFRTH